MTYKEDYFQSSILKEITVRIPLELDADNPGYKTINEKEINQIEKGPKNLENYIKQKIQS